MTRMELLAAGCGAEAAIGQLTRLTSLHLSLDRRRTAPTKSDNPATQQSQPLASVPLQLQLLGCSRAAGGASGNASMGSCSSCSLATRRNTSLQELTLEILGPLSDDELAAAAAALPDLRRLEVASSPIPHADAMRGLHGATLATFSACRRLRDISLPAVGQLDGRQLVAQLPHISSLADLQLIGCPSVGDDAQRALVEAFVAAHGRRLRVNMRRTA
jgi:hypothetical protein